MMGPLSVAPMLLDPRDNEIMDAISDEPGDAGEISDRIPGRRYPMKPSIIGNRLIYLLSIGLVERVMVIRDGELRGAFRLARTKRLDA